MSVVSDQYLQLIYSQLLGLYWLLGGSTNGVSVHPHVAFLSHHDTLASNTPESLVNRCRVIKIVLREGLLDSLCGLFEKLV